MTVKKTMRRPVLRFSKSPKLTRELVADLEQWFEGATPHPWALLLPGPDYREEIGERWRAWKRAHPDARSPAGFDEWIDAPEQP